MFAVRSFGFSFGRLTRIRGHRFQQINGFQMFGRGNGERQNVTNGLVKTWVGSTTEAHRLVLVLQVILDMSHLMVYSEELLHCYCGALLNSAKNEKSVVYFSDSHMI